MAGYWTYLWFGLKLFLPAASVWFWAVFYVWLPVEKLHRDGLWQQDIHARGAEALLLGTLLWIFAFLPALSYRYLNGVQKKKEKEERERTLAWQGAVMSDDDYWRRRIQKTEFQE